MLNRIAYVRPLWFNTPSATAHTKGETMEIIAITYTTEGRKIKATLQINGHSFTGAGAYTKTQAVKNAMMCFLI